MQINSLAITFISHQRIISPPNAIPPYLLHLAQICCYMLPFPPFLSMPHLHTLAHSPISPLFVFVCLSLSPPFTFLAIAPLCRSLAPPPLCTCTIPLKGKAYLSLLNIDINRYHLLPPSCSWFLFSLQKGMFYQRNISLLAAIPEVFSNCNRKEVHASRMCVYQRLYNVPQIKLS